ncbi:MAG: hypothetical protein A2V70_18860 [Planctomycetes bacterium RBG_13_63_9]|nr:MAG: hypothetical protein A2V70_18860 [Planctomycetes bacterium RBG_13_63_9]
MRAGNLLVALWFVLAIVHATPAQETIARDEDPWRVGAPIVTYFAGPPMSDQVARQMAAAGFNVVWCGVDDLDVVHRHGLRGMVRDGLLSPTSLDTPEQRQTLDALIDRVRKHPGAYSYYIVDEPSASAFPALGKLVSYLRQRDPARMAYINLFPTYASNEQLGTKGDVITAYRQYLRQYVDVVKPALLSYDHYQFMTAGDSSQYFLNLSMVREESHDSGVPWLNIVQASSWHPTARVPVADEMRYLVYTTAAHGAQGISYYVYTAAGHRGGMALADGTPTPIYDAIKSLNREFVAVVTELQPLHCRAVYHTAMKEPGCVPLPKEASFQPDASSEPGRGMMLGCFGQREESSHALLVNLDYKAGVSTTLSGPGSLQVFDAAAGKWSSPQGSRVQLDLLPGGGMLVRVSP